LAQSIPGLTEGVDGGIEILVQPEGEKPLAQIEPDPLDWVEFRAVRRQGNQSDVVGHVQRLDVVPSGLIDHERDVGCLGENSAKNKSMVPAVASGSTKAKASSVVGRTAAKM